MRYHYEFVETQDDLPVRLFVNSVKDIRFHWHKEIELIYVLQGAVTVYVDQRQYRLAEDDIIAINSMSVHKLERTNLDNVLLTLQFGPELLDDEGTLFDCNSMSQTEYNRYRYDRLRRCLARMVWESNKKGPGHRNYSMGSLQTLIGHLTRYFTAGTGVGPQEKGKDYDYMRLNRIIQYVDKHYNEKITLQTIADQEHLSLHYFSHFFSDKIGIPFQKYLTLIRLEKAAAQLSDTDKSITQIALDCGFANVKLFNQYFKGKYGSTPGSYRDTLANAKMPDPARKPLTTEESSSGDYYETDTISAMESLYRYLNDREGSPPVEHDLPSDMRVVVDVQADAGIREEVFLKHWNRVTTAGRAVEGLREDWRRQFAGMQGEFPFTHIRFHGIFNDEMMVYSEDEDGKPVYNWAYVDKLYDFLLQSGIHIFVELSFMPALLRRSNETIFWWKGGISPPADQEKWNGLVREFVRHCVNRYGLAEVKKWYFEVWNEPDLTDVCWSGTKEEYFAFYEATANTIKSVSPELTVGGPALGYGSLWNDSWAEQFIAYCRDRQVPLNFFSFHVYSEYPFQKKEIGKLTTIMPPSYFLDSINLLKEKIGYGQPHTPELHITEWNFSLYDRNLLHDTMFMAPFIIHHALATSGAVDSIAYWSFTDVFEESQVLPSMFYGGFGLINREGLRKPGYYAFRLLSRLGSRIIAQGDGYIVTRNENEDVQILLYHYVHVDSLYASGDRTGLTELNRYSVFEEKGHKRFRIALEGLSGSYKRTRHVLDREHGSVFDEWIRLGSPAFPTEEELKYLHSRSGPDMRTDRLKLSEGYAEEAVVPPHGVQLIILEKQYG
ncbi:GH39 family glycosyl hydrolase [Paenibacillus sp. MMO-58]|uniref:GH39 family glycosyl hydrolase n=1 Tax=Paenibacillus sp. MMO-58 TaxID=3081290 RepID=UPI00301A7C2D